MVKGVFGKSGNIIIIKEEEFNGKRIDTWKMNTENKKLTSAIFNYLFKKYNLLREIPPYVKKDGSRKIFGIEVERYNAGEVW